MRIDQLVKSLWKLLGCCAKDLLVSAQRNDRVGASELGALALGESRNWALASFPGCRLSAAAAEFQVTEEQT